MFCPHCGSQNQEDAQFCATCGQKMNNEQKAQEAASQPGGQESYQQQPVGENQTYGYQQNADYPQNQNGQPGGRALSDYLVGNIIVSIFSLLCCNPAGIITGIIGIVFSSGVKSALSAGRQAEAVSKANTAKIMFFITLGLAILALVGWILILALGSVPFLEDVRSNML